MKTRWKIGLAVLSLCGSTTALALDPMVETVDVKITGGPNAGSYGASTTEAGCSANMTGPNSFGNQLSSLNKDPKKFNSVQLILPDAKKAASGTKEFYISVGFGSVVNRSAEYIVDTQPDTKKKTGSGIITLSDHGATAEVKFSVTTANNVKIEGTISCLSVVRG